MSEGSERQPGRERVLLVCQGGVDTVAVVTRFVNQAKTLQSLDGIELHVVWILDRSYSRDSERKLWAENIGRDWEFPRKVVYSPLFSRFGLPARVLFHLYPLFPLAFYILRHKIDVVLVHSVFGAQGLLLGLRKLLRFRGLLDLQGAVPEELAYRGKESKIVGLMDTFERKALSRCDFVFSVSQRLVNHITHKHGVPTGKFLVVPCCVPMALVGANSEMRQQMRRDLGLEDNFVVAYCGGTDAYQCVPDMCALFAAISRHREDAFWMVLSWGDHGLFRRCLAEHGVNEKRFRLMSVEQTAVHDHLVAADVGLLLREDHVLNRVASPTKFAEYLAAGVPVIATPYVGDVSDLVLRESIGTIVDLPFSNDRGELMRFLEEVVERRDEFTRQCLEFVDREWTWEGHREEFALACGVSGRNIAEFKTALGEGVAEPW